MEIDPNVEAQALTQALEQYPHYRDFQPRLAWRPLFQGGAWTVEFGTEPQPRPADAWDFQNAVVKTYRRLSGR